MRAYLEVIGPEGAGRVRLGGTRLAVGRDEANDIVLAGDARVSRRHALLEKLAAGWSVADQGSTNGTFVNGQLLTDSRPLYSGEEIALGETRLVYRQDG